MKRLRKPLNLTGFKVVFVGLGAGSRRRTMIPAWVAGVLLISRTSGAGLRTSFMSWRSGLESGGHEDSQTVVGLGREKALA
jgi:hypothetical protein